MIFPALLRCRRVARVMQPRRSWLLFLSLLHLKARYRLPGFRHWPVPRWRLLYTEMRPPSSPLRMMTWVSFTTALHPNQVISRPRVSGCVYAAPQQTCGNLFIAYVLEMRPERTCKVQPSATLTTPLMPTELALEP